MKLGVIKKILKEDLVRAGGTVPPWVDPFLVSLNQFIDAVVTALQGRLSFFDNISCKIETQTFTSGTELLLNPQPTPQSSLRVTGVLPVDCGGKTLSKTKLSRKASGLIGVTLTFDEGGDSTCTVIILLG